MTTLTWINAAERLPDSDMTVLCWTADGEWFAGWWDDASTCWRCCVDGTPLEPVTHWAEPEGPT